jgi:hypothetical protein
MYDLILKISETETGKGMLYAIFEISQTICDELSLQKNFQKRGA